MRRPSTSLIVVLIVVLITAAVSVRGLWIGEDGAGWRTTIRSDAKGYYGYLQAIFLRNDLGNEPYVWEYVRETPTGTLNKYFCGTSVMMAPWFAVGHAVALTDPTAPKDGLSVYEMRALSIGAWVYLLLGLLAVRSVLRGIVPRDCVVAWVIVAIGLGTQLMQYTALQPGWSHIYSFSAISVFLLIIHRLGRGARLWWAVAAAALLGLIVLIRPVNGLVALAIPVVLGNGTWPLMQRILQRPAMLIAAVVAGALVVGVQPLLWHAQTGNWFAYGYRGEGFHWDRPEVFKVLFGFRRGLFLWAPVLLLSAWGTVAIWRTDRTRSVSMVLYWMANTYVISSWWIWYYGSGFGSRVFVDHYPVLAIPMALVLHQNHGKWWTLARTYIVVCVALLAAQMWQYHAHILHHESMDRRKYARTFLRFDDALRHRLGGNYQAPPFHPNGMDAVLEESCDLERDCTYWKGGRIEERPEAFSGKRVCVFTDSTEYGITFIAEPGQLPTGRALYLEVGLQRYEEEAGDSHTMMGITEVKGADGQIAYYEPFAMNPLPGVARQWEQLEYRIPVPPLVTGDRLSFYFWNKDRNARMLIDDVFMRVSAARPY